jgi:hypothetical protein
MDREDSKTAACRNANCAGYKGQGFQIISATVRLAGMNGITWVV